MIVGEAVKPQTILLVEDNWADANLLRLAFETEEVEAGLEVIYDAAPAMEYLSRRGPYADAPRPCLVLLDLSLPDVSGHDLLAWIKSDPVLEFIPVVVLTSSSDPLENRRSYLLGANSHICKPFDFQGYLDVVHGLRRFWVNRDAPITA